MSDLPIGRGNAWNTVRRRDLRLVHRDFGKCSGGLIPFQGGSVKSGKVDIAAKVTRQVAEVSGLLDDGATPNK